MRKPGIGQLSLGYEPYGVRLCRLALSLVAALTSADGRRAFVLGYGVSLVSTRPAASRAQIRAQIWLLTYALRVYQTVEHGAVQAGTRGRRQLVSVLAHACPCLSYRPRSR